MRSETARVGMRSVRHRLDAVTDQLALPALVAGLNADPTVHGILVQLPSPPQIDAASVLDAIDPAKDVDGFHPVDVAFDEIGHARAATPVPGGVGPMTIACLLANTARGREPDRRTRCEQVRGMTWQR